MSTVGLNSPYPDNPSMIMTLRFGYWSYTYNLRTIFIAVNIPTHPMRISYGLSFDPWSSENTEVNTCEPNSAYDCFIIIDLEELTPVKYIHFSADYEIRAIELLCWT